MKAPERIRRYPLEAICVLLLLAMTLVVLLQVLSRYVLPAPLSWTEELARFLLIWLSFLGAVVCLHHRQHLSIDLFVARLPMSLQRANRVFVIFSMSLFFVLTLVKGVKLTLESMGQQSVIMGIPFPLFYISIPITMALMIIRLLRPGR